MAANVSRLPLVVSMPMLPEVLVALARSVSKSVVDQSEPPGDVQVPPVKMIFPDEVYPGRAAVSFGWRVPAVTVVLPL